MKKLLFVSLIFITSSILINCKDNSDKEKIEIVKNDRKSDKILLNLIEKYSNYQSNNLVKEEMQKELDSKIDSIYKLNFLEDIPMKILRIGKNPHGKGALVHFFTDNDDKSEHKNISNKLKYDIIGFMKEDMASKINQDSTYYVSGKMLKRLNDTEAFLIVPQVYHSPGTEIQKDINDKYSFNIGVFLMEVQNIK